MNLNKKTKVKKPAGAPNAVIIQKIETRPFHRTEQDIPKWRQAIQSAESQIPRRNLLYNLYADVDLDGHVEAVTGKRKDPVKAANWQFVDKEGMPIDEINEVIDSIGFDNMLEEIMNSRFWGYTILEPKFWKDDSDNWQMDEGLLPRLNYRPENGIVAFTSTGDEGIKIREGIYAKTVMEVGKVKDLGLYMKAAPYAILKRGGWGDYAAFIQTFGTPLIDATWNGFDEKQRLLLNQALQNIGAGGVIIRPEGTTIDVKDNKASDTGNAHDNFIKGLNKEISKALLGSTETTESSSSSGYAQSETHQEQDELKHMNDLAFTRKILNSRFIRILQAYGFDTQGGQFIIQGEDQELNKTESFEIHSKIASEIGLPIDDDFWYETYGIPKPENYEQMKKAQEAAKVAPEEKAPEKDPKKDPEPGKAKQKDDEADVKLTEKSWLFKLYRRFFVKAPAVTTGAACGVHHTNNIELAQGDKLNEDALIQRIYDAAGNATFDQDLFFYTAGVLTLGFKEGWDKQNTIELKEAPGFMYGYDDPAVLTAYEQNLFRFSGAKTLAEVQRLNELFRESTSFAEFYEKAKEVTRIFNQNWLETEYTTAVLTGEAASTYHRLKAQTDVFPYWKYTTAGDHLVRPEHVVLDGLTLRHDDPRWEKIFPPNGWNCRCYIVPRMEHEVSKAVLKTMQERADLFLDSAQFEKEKAQGWGVNRAIAGEVFTANQQYVNKFPGKASKMLNDLRPSDFGLQSYSQAKKAATANVPVYEEKAGSFFEKLEKIGDHRILRDYSKRPLQIRGGNGRVDLLEALTQVLNSPSEVWIQDKELNRLVYIKYYQDGTIVANAKITGGQLQLVKWLQLEEKKDLIELLRKGLLIFKP